MSESHRRKGACEKQCELVFLANSELGDETLVGILKISSKARLL